MKWFTDSPYAAGSGQAGTPFQSMTNSSAIPVRSSCAFFLLLYLQIRLRRARQLTADMHD